MTLGCDLKSMSNQHNHTLTNTQKAAFAIHPRATCYGALHSSWFFLLQLKRVFRVFSRKLSPTQISCSRTTCVILSLLPIDWNCKLIHVGIAYFQIEAFCNWSYDLNTTWRHQNSHLEHWSMHLRFCTLLPCLQFLLVSLNKVVHLNF